MFLIALAAFVVCSAAADAAPTIQLLVVARLLPQGLAAGLLTPQNSGLIQNLFTGAERPGAFGMFGTTIGMSTAPGPARRRADPGFDGRLALDPFVHLPIGIVALVLAARLIPRVPGSGREHREIDRVGAGLLGGAVFAVLPDGDAERDLQGSPELDAGGLEPAPVLPHCGLDRIGCDEVSPHLGGRLPLFQQRVRLVPADRGALNDARSEPDMPALVTEDQLHPLANTRQPDGQAL